MLKFLLGSKKLYIRQSQDLNNDSINNINKNKEENTLGNYLKDKSYLDDNNNKQNNLNFEVKKHHSPSSIKSPILLPKIKNSFKKDNSQKKLNISKLYSQGGLFGIPPPDMEKKIKKDKTQISILENMHLNNNDKQQNNKKYQQVNNITNINIHIYSNDLNNADDNLKNDMLKSKLNKTNNNNTLSTPINNTLKIKTISNSNSANNNTINNINTLNNNNKDSIFSYQSKINLKKNNIKYIYENPFNNISFDKNNDHKFLFNFNKNKDLNIKKHLSNSLPNININKKEYSFHKHSKSKSDLTQKIINNSLDKNNYDINNISIIKNNNGNNNNNWNNSLDINSINTSMNFLRDISSDTSKFILFIKLIQIHMDIAILIDSNDSSKGKFRRKTSTVLGTELIYKLNALINNYFNILTIIYNNNIIINTFNINNYNNINNNKISNRPIDCFFLLSALNNIFHKIIKIQICLYAAILVTLSQLGQYELSSMIKNNFNKILKKISSSLLNFFEHFIKEDINLNYPELIKNNLRQDFFEQINKCIKTKKKVYNNSEIILLIENNINKACELMTHYSLVSLKYSLIKPFGDTLNQMISSIDKRNLYQFITIFLKTILFGELEINKKKVIQNGINFKSRFPNIKQINNMNYSGSAFINNIREMPPFLSPMHLRYKYTLVLDMDETLLHFFFTNIKGMFFVRPYCFEFLNDLNNLYEIITFTAGTKDYADNILNQLDINDNIIKYRLYRQHTTIYGLSAYKDLNKLGRDLSKIIIIDNLKENFKMQPNNGLFIKTWTNDVNDTQLKDLLKILKDIVINNVDDVRPIIQKINEEIKLSGNLINPYSKINIQKIITHISKKKK